MDNHRRPQRRRKFTLFTVGAVLVYFTTGMIVHGLPLLLLSEYYRADAEALVTKIDSSYKGFSTEEEAVASFENARRKGLVRIVRE